MIMLGVNLLSVMKTGNTISPLCEAEKEASRVLYASLMEVARRFFEYK